MGKKNRTRKTKWRQMSLDNSSGPEEELDDQQQQQQQQQQQEQQQQQQRPSDALETSGDNGALGEAESVKVVQGHRQRRPYYRHHSNHAWGRVNSPNDEQTKPTIQHTTFNNEEYTKISTPRQEVLLKKGFIGKKKLTVETSHHNTNDNEDVTNGNEGEMVSEMSGTEVSSPMYCYPMPYGGYYQQGIIMQEMYPGGPVVAAAVPVALPIQPVYPVYYGDVPHEEIHERSRKNSGDSSQASGSTAQEAGSSENSESSSPEPLSPGPDVQDPFSAMEPQKMEPIMQYPSLVYVYPTGYAFAQPLLTNG